MLETLNIVTSIAVLLLVVQGVWASRKRSDAKRRFERRIAERNEAFQNLGKAVQDHSELLLRVAESQSQGLWEQYSSTHGSFAGSMMLGVRVRPHRYRTFADRLAHRRWNVIVTAGQGSGKAEIGGLFEYSVEAPEQEYSHRGYVQVATADLREPRWFSKLDEQSAKLAKFLTADLSKRPWLLSESDQQTELWDERMRLHPLPLPQRQTETVQKEKLDEEIVH